MAAAFDTLRYAKQLKQAGVPEDQAEIHAEALRGVLEEQIAARFDRVDERFDRVDGHFVQLEARVDARFAQVDKAIADLKADAAVLRQEFAVQEERNGGRFRLLYWMAGFNLALTVAVLWLLIRSGI